MFNILLQILDDGRVTDSQGRMVSFKNAILIMTSNMGSQYIVEGMQKDPEGVKELVMSQVCPAYNSHHSLNLPASQEQSSHMQFNPASLPRTVITYAVLSLPASQ